MYYKTYKHNKTNMLNVIKQIGFQNTNRQHINFMKCFNAFKYLRTMMRIRTRARRNFYRAKTIPSLELQASPPRKLGDSSVLCPQSLREHIEEDLNEPRTSNTEIRFHGISWVYLKTVYLKTTTVYQSNITALNLRVRTIIQICIDSDLESPLRQVQVLASAP